jgi:hypothetical protein
LYCLVPEDLESHINESVDEWLNSNDFNSLHQKGLIDIQGIEGKDYTEDNIPSHLVIVSPSFRRDIIYRELFRSKDSN